MGIQGYTVVYMGIHGYTRVYSSILNNYPAKSRGISSDT